MSLTKLVRIRSNDRKVLAFLGPVFALVTASNVVTISFAKALYLAHNDSEALPWMFISAAVFTMLLSVGYVALAGSADAGKRLRSMLALASVSFVGLGALSRSDPAQYSLLIFAWSTGIGQLVMIQSWTWSANCVPTRQARRLFPMFSALATAGATGGGLLTKALIEDVGLVGLLFLAIVLLLGAMIVVHWTPAWDQDEQVTEPQAQASPLKRIPVAISALRSTPLLARIALLVFLVQAASVILDYQFSAAIQAHFDQKSDEMAGFIGIYYAVSNTVTFLMAFMATGKLSRILGIGLSSASAAFAARSRSGGAPDARSALTTASCPAKVVAASPPLPGSPSGAPTRRASGASSAPAGADSSARGMVAGRANPRRATRERARRTLTSARVDARIYY